MRSSNSSSSYVAAIQIVNTIVTPEPSTYAMMALGLCAVGLIGWKRKKSEDAS